MAEVRGCHRVHTACRTKILTQALYRKHLLTSDLNQKFIINDDWPLSTEIWIQSRLSADNWEAISRASSK